MTILRDASGVDVKVRQYGRFVGRCEAKALVLHWLLSWGGWQGTMRRFSTVAMECAAAAAADDHCPSMARTWLDRAEKLMELSKC